MKGVLHFLALLLFGLAIAWGCSHGSQAQAPIQLGLPIDCQLGQDCFVLLYPDRDPTPKQSIDFGCGRMTYDNHQGTDFAVPDEKAVAQGVKILAAAPGTVLRVRDGVRDRRIRDPNTIDKIEKTACGNGLLIDHGEGWSTQYCHLRQDSLTVKPGDPVTQGQPIGLVGLSGKTTFPHVHLTVRFQDQIVDPFVGPQAAPGCQVKRQSLWLAPIPYNPTGLIRAGFAPQPPQLEDIWQGQYHENQLPADSEALLFWVQAYGVLAKDREQFMLIDPNGQVVAENTREYPKPLRIALNYIGQRKQASTFIPGKWQGQYQLSRNGKILIEIKQTITIR